MDFLRLLFPKKSVWHSWDAGVKIGFFGLWLAIIALLITLAPYIYSFLHDDTEAIASPPQRKFEYTTIQELSQNIPQFNAALASLNISDIGKRLNIDSDNLKLEDIKIFVLGNLANTYDLNNDGFPEIGVKNIRYCGASGNCTVLLYSYDQNKNTLSYIGTIEENGMFLITPYINGWAQIRTRLGMGICNETWTNYSYRAGQYMKSQSEDIYLCDNL